MLRPCVCVHVRPDVCRNLRLYVLFLISLLAALEVRCARPDFSACVRLCVCARVIGSHLFVAMVSGVTSSACTRDPLNAARLSLRPFSSCGAQQVAHPPASLASAAACVGARARVC